MAAMSGSTAARRGRGLWPKAIILSLAGALLGNGLAADGGGSQPVIVGALTFPGDPFDQYWQRFNTAMAAQGENGLEVKLFIRGELGPEEVLMSALRRGRVHMSSFTASGLTAVIPEFTITLAPYLFRSYEEVDQVLDNHLGPLLVELCRDAGLEFLTWNDEGWFNVYAKQPLLLPSEAVHYRMRR